MCREIVGLCNESQILSSTLKKRKNQLKNPLFNVKKNLLWVCYGYGRYNIGMVGILLVWQVGYNLSKQKYFFVQSWK